MDEPAVLCERCQDTGILDYELVCVESGAASDTVFGCTDCPTGRVWWEAMSAVSED